MPAGRSRAAARITMVAMGLLAPASLLPAVVSAQAEPRQLRSVRFEGATAFSDAILHASIESEPGRCRNILLEAVCFFGLAREHQNANLNILQGDAIRLQLLYYEHGYRSARVVLDTVSEQGQLHAIFRITEGLPVQVGSVDIAGIDQVDSRSRARLLGAVSTLPLQPDRPFSMIAYEAARDTLINRLHNLGYAHADVFANARVPRDSARVAHVTYELAPAGRVYFGEPEVQGNERVSSRVIRRMLAFKEGDVYSRDAVLRSHRSLYSLEIFRNIDIHTDLDAAGDTITPLVTIQEGALNRFRAGMGLNTAEFFNAEGRWTGRNFMGGARRIEVRARLANVLADPLEVLPVFENTSAPYDALNGSLNLDFTQPWFFDAGNNFSAGLFFERRSIPGVFVRTARGGYLAVSRTLGAGTSAGIGYRPELTELNAEDEIFCINFVACEESEIRLLSEPHRLAPLVLSLARDRSNGLFAPTRGYILRLEAEYAAAATGSEFAYARLIGEWTLYREPAAGLVLATRVRPGWARSINEPGAGLGLHLQKRFFAGGANSVRGFGQYRLGPKLLKIGADTLLVPDLESGFAGCSAQQINAGTCDVSLLAEHRRGLFHERPVGGAVSFEANVEARFALVGEKLRGAAFIDIGQVWTAGAKVRPTDLVPTPGLGLRFMSAIGPVRVDLGYNTETGGELQVLTTKVCVPEDGRCTADSIRDDVVYTPDQLGKTRVLVPLGKVPWGMNRSPWDRIQLHFSIGQAF
ncbi:MAG: BamA/TamA family outer membrane protein [Gemmatimonadota bacterium]